MNNPVFKHYPEPFDVYKPPPSPPNRDMNYWPFIGWTETKESKIRREEYLIRLNDYGAHFNKGQRLCRKIQQSR